MNVEERIAQLEALLARVRSRSRVPHEASDETNRDARLANGVNRTATPGRAAYVDAAATTGSTGWSDVPSAPNGWQTDSDPPPSMMSAPMLSDAIEANIAREENEESEERTIQEHPAAENVQPLRMGMRAPEPSQTRVIDPQPLEVIELDIDPDPSMLPPGMESVNEEPFESRSRLVAAPAIARGDAIDDESRAIASDPMREASGDATDVSEVIGAMKEARVEAIASSDLGLPELEELEELDEPAPSSSRRPISVEEKLKQLAEEDDSTHAAPPESGKLLATPILNLDEPDVAAGRRGHEERGGSGGTTGGPAVVPAVVPAGFGAGGRAIPEVARATLEENDVAAFTGKAGEARAATFGELLDAAMKL